MLNGKFRGKDVGRARTLEVRGRHEGGPETEAESLAAEGCMARSNGHCMTMGTASTMACMAEALGMQLPGSAAIRTGRAAT